MDSPEIIPEGPRVWADDNPFFLLILLAAGHARIDLGEVGWATKYADYMRVRSTWFLCAKADESVRLMVVINEGDQPYYVKRHHGQIKTDGSAGREAACWGIGKKAADGTMTRLWVMPDGLSVCGGDDDAVLTMLVVQQMDWVEQPPE